MSTNQLIDSPRTDGRKNANAAIRNWMGNSLKRIYAGPLDFVTNHSFDLTPNEDRFIVHTPDPGGDMIVLLNWPSLLR